MTENKKEYVYTKEWLDQKIEQDRVAQDQAEEERREDRDRENIRAAWRQQTGCEPTNAEVEKTLAEKRRIEVAQAARVNEAEATRQFVQRF